MITAIPMEDTDILAFSASGKVTGEDYEQVLVPAIDAALEKEDKVRFLYQIGPDFDGYENDAMWDDTKIGMKHFTDFERIAVVADETWIRRSVKAFGFLFPGEVKLFHNDQLAEAKTWIVE